MLKKALKVQRNLYGLSKEIQTLLWCFLYDAFIISVPEQWWEDAGCLSSMPALPAPSLRFETAHIFGFKREFHAVIIISYDQFKFQSLDSRNQFGLPAQKEAQSHLKIGSWLRINHRHFHISKFSQRQDSILEELRR